MISDYSKEDFDKCLYNVFAIPRNRTIASVYPIFKQYKEFKGDLGELNNNNMIRYIVYVYDKNSPLQAVDEMPKRKAEAAALAGFVPKSDGEFHEDLVRVMKGTHDIANKMIIRYLRMQKRPTYSLLVATNEAYYAALEKMIDNSQDAGKIVYKEVRDMKKEMDACILDLFEEDNTQELEDALFRYIEEEELADLQKLRPEGRYAAKV